MLTHFTSSPKTLLTQFTTEKPSSDMAFSCATCGLCAQMCPTDIDFGYIFNESKKEYATDKKVLKGYGYGALMFHQKNSFSKLFSTTMKFSEGKYKHMAFMPGCALSSYSPTLVQNVFAHLQSKLDGLGIIQQCCGTPTRMVGDIVQFERYHAKLESDLAMMGADTVVTACENCYMSIKTYAPHIKILSLYEVLADVGVPEKAHNAYHAHEKVALHDPCPTRYEKGLQDSVRTLLDTIGLPYEEFKFNRAKTLCCGSGGMLELTNAPLAKAQMQSRANQTSCNSIVSYCQSCAESMSKGGKNGVHLLDFIFSSPEYKEQTKNGTLRKWYNRYRSRKMIETLKESPSKR